MDEDPGAPNYDPKLKLIKSMMNGSRGPMLRDATPLDWTGDPIDVKNRFPSLGHGEDDYKMMLQHFVGYEDVVGDQPLNLASTQLATNAYMLTHQQKYKDWVLGYCDAWAQRATRQWRHHPLQGRAWTARSAAPEGQMVGRRLWLGLLAHRADDRQAGGPQPRAVVLQRLHERLSAVQGRRQISGCVAQDRRQVRRRRQGGGRQDVHPHHVSATRASTVSSPATTISTSWKSMPFR